MTPALSHIIFPFFPFHYQKIQQDVMMPDVDGVELLRHVRAEPSLRDVPVVSAF